MFNSKLNNITSCAKYFLEPSNSTHRQYEALRTYFVERIPAKEVAKRFNYSQGSFRVLLHKFRRNPERPFFLPPAKGPQTSPKKDKVRQTVISLRKQNYSIYDISHTLSKEKYTISPVSISLILNQEGFTRLSRRPADQRPLRPLLDQAPVTDVRQLDLTPRQFRTKFGGLFLFLPYLAKLPFDQIFHQICLPGSKMIPAAHAIRSLLALKLFGSARHSHVMSYVLDQGIALFCGLNEIPKRSFLTEYSCRIDPSVYPEWMRLWFNSISKLGLSRGNSFDLDFHTIPFHGEDALVEKHYVSKRSRRQKGIIAFIAQDALKHIFCYANAQIRKNYQNDEILRFVEFWKHRTESLPDELIFDSKLTTYANLNKLNIMKVSFITPRRRSRKMIEEIYKQSSAWQRIELKNVSRSYRTPRILDGVIKLPNYHGPIRQIAITDFGHEEPTFLLTNQLKRPAPILIQRYAQRMIIENNIEDGIDFFHMDALSSSVAMKINCDLQLTLMASSLYRIMAQQIANGYENAKSRKIFRDFIDATAMIGITPSEITVRFQKRAHNPLLIAAGFRKADTPIPWLANRKLKLIFG